MTGDHGEQLPAKLSVIIPAHNEAVFLPQTLTALRNALAPIHRRHEVVVVDNASADGTAEVARTHGARVVGEPHRQISRARNTGAAHTDGEYLLFVDADTRPPPALIGRALDLLDAGACGGGALMAFDHLPGRVYRYGLRIWNALARRFSLAPGCFIFVRREAFEAVGRFDERLYAGDEVFISRRLHRWGRAHGHPFTIIGDPPVITSARKAEWFSLPHHVAITALVLLCPWSLRSRRLMWFWYRSPRR